MANPTHPATVFHHTRKNYSRYNHIESRSAISLESRAWRKHTQALLYRTFSFAVVNKALQQHIFNFQNPDTASLQQYGYLSIEQELASADDERTASLEKRRTILLADTSALLKRKNKNLRQLIKKNKPFKRTAYITYLEELAAKASERNVHLYFVASPLYNGGPGIEKTVLASQIISDRFIDIADSNKYPEFYTVENCFDYAHLNENGAKLYTSYLADEFKHRLKSPSL